MDDCGRARRALRRLRASLHRRGVAWVLLLAAVGPVALPVQAERWRWGEVDLSLDTFLSATMSLRTASTNCLQIGGEVLPGGPSNGGCNSDPDPAVNGVLNGRLLNSDDGNLNIEKGDVYSVLVSVSHDVDLTWRNYGAFVRLLYFYDGIQIANWDGYTPRRTPYSDDARWRPNVLRGGVVGVDFRVLDAYGWARFKPLGRRMELRFGNQVVNWGEEFFTQGGIKATNAFDVTKLRIAGSELKQGLVPAPMVRFNTDVIGDLTFETYYQFDWNPTEIDPTGTFYAINDMVARGAQGQFTGQDPGTTGIPAEDLLAMGPLAGGVPRGTDREPDDQGQWGAAFRYYWDWIETELGLYYVRFHDKFPTVSYQGSGFSAGDVYYYTEWVENINLYGASFNTTVGGVAIAGEVSFRPNQPTPISSAYTDLLAQGFVGSERGMVRERRVMGIVNGLWVAGPGSWGVGPALHLIGADDMTFIGEFAVVNYPDLDPSISYAAPNAVSPDIHVDLGGLGRIDNTWRPDNTSLGYQLRVSATYSQVFGTAVTLMPTLAFRHDAYGTTPDTGTQFTDGRMYIALQLEAQYQNDWKGLITYSNSFGGGKANVDSDRDFIQLGVSYAF